MEGAGPSDFSLPRVATAWVKWGCCLGRRLWAGRNPLWAQQTPGRKRGQADLELPLLGVEQDGLPVDDRLEQQALEQVIHRAAVGGGGERRGKGSEWHVRGGEVTPHNIGHHIPDSNREGSCGRRGLVPDHHAWRST